MALVSCKECGARVAALAPTCPSCGVVRPGTATGELVILRSTSVTGIMHAVQVTVDGRLMGEIWNGKTITLELPIGEHQVRVSGGGLSRSVTIQIDDRATVKYETYFSNWGILGGGLNFKPM